jgi:flagellar operon protein
MQFSEHALKRVDQRGISLDGDQLDRLQKAMDTLGQRGSRQSLVMLDQVAYVVHVPSHTVVTAVQPDENKDRVFTQIDSVVIA